MKQSMIKTTEEIALLSEGGKRLAEALGEVRKAVKAGVSTAMLDQVAEEAIRSRGGKPSFKGYRGFPATLCTSINEEVVHGIPISNRVLNDGDIIGLDIGMIYQGLFTDMAITVPVGPVDAKARDLMIRTREALKRGIAAAVAGNTIGDIGASVQSYCEGFGYGVVRELVGHGVGYAVHELPQIPNVGTPGTGMRLESGMVLALEPMITLGSYRIETLSDGWTVVTADGSTAAHFEQTIAILEDRTVILTPFPWETS